VRKAERTPRKANKKAYQRLESRDEELREGRAKLEIIGRRLNNGAQRVGKAVENEVFAPDFDTDELEYRGFAGRQL